MGNVGPHDFTFTPLPPDLVHLSEELDELGGGDTRIAKVQVFGRPFSSTTKPRDTIVFTEGNTLIVRDPRIAPSSPHKQTARRYHLTGILHESQEDVFEAVGIPMLEWVWEGFSAMVVTIGQVGMGKTYALFGRDPWDFTGTSSTQGVFMRILTQLCERIEHSGSTQYMVGLSVWDILENNIIDLLVPDTDNTSKKHMADVTIVQASTLSIAMQLLEVARSRSVNWSKTTPTGVAEFLPNRGHHFVRLSLYNLPKQSVSFAYFVDLVGHGHNPAPSVEPSNPHIPVLLNRERQIAKQQLVGLGRIVAELAKADGGPMLISTRDSILSQTLGPLLAGNCKTFILASMSTHKDDFAETVHTLRFAKRAQNITAGCMRVSGANMDALIPAEEILPSPYILNIASASLKAHPAILPNSLSVSAIPYSQSLDSSEQIVSQPMRKNIEHIVEKQPSASSHPQPHSTPVSAIKQQMRHVMKTLDINEDPHQPKVLSNDEYDAPTDDYLLQRNYKSVLGLLEQEQQLRFQFATRAAAADQKLVEVTLAQQLEIDVLKGENLQLRVLVRKMEQNTNFAEVFDIYERDMTRIALEIRRLRDENVELNERLESESNNTQKKPLHSPTIPLTHELELLREESQRQDRRNFVHLRLIDDASRKLSEVSQQLRARDMHTQKLEAQLAETRSKLEHTENEKMTIGNDFTTLHNTLLKEKEAFMHLQQEMTLMRAEYLQQKKASVLSKLNVPTKERKTVSPSIAQLFDRLHELGMVDQKYGTLLNKLKNEIVKLEQELSRKEIEQQRLLTICIENIPQQSDAYFTNIERFQEILHSKINSLDAIVTKPRNKSA